MEDHLFLAVFVLFQITFIVQLYFIIIVQGRFRGYKGESPEKSEESGPTPVSVIICARNEEKNLVENLPSIFAQDYPLFEVVVVNDCSYDDSDVVLHEFAEKHANLKIVTLNEHALFKHGKKFAVTLGIKAASYEHLLFTDADCRPASDQWIRRMQQHFRGETEIVLGYSPYESRRGLLNAHIRFETFYTALNYFSFALRGRAYMGVGRNLSYTKSLFFRNKGFASHMHIPSGDDDLFVNENSTPANTVIEATDESHVWSKPKTTWKGYFNQKIRHMGAGRAYKTRDKRTLSLQVGSSVLFYIFLGLLGGLKPEWWYYFVGAYGLRLIAQLFVYYPTLKKLRYGDLFAWVPALDLFYNLFITVLSILSLFKKKVQWK